MRKALLIGINEYPHPYQLRGCVNDIEQLGELLARDGLGNIDFDVRKLPNVQSSSEAMREIQKLFSDDAEISLLYFSGHGSLDNLGAQIVFPQDISDGSCYNGIQLQSILMLANESKAKNKIIILDSCHAGFMGKFGPTIDASLISSGVSILVACREDETAAECGTHGLFTELLCNALSGGAADFLGNITIGGIYAYIDRSLGAWHQRPVFKTNVTEFVSLRTVTAQVPIEIIRQLKTLFPDDTNEIALNPSFEYTNTLEEVHDVIEPYAIKENVDKFKALQKLESIGFVRPVGEEHMYFAAMRSKTCELTALGRYYRRLVNENRI